MTEPLLLPCRECGHTIAIGAKWCPSCGARNPWERRWGWQAWLLFAVLLIPAGLWLRSCGVL